jgi:hypothetical protein
MTARKPLVIVSGQLQELSASDTLSAAVSAIDVVSKTNDNAGAITKGMCVYVKSNGNVDKAKADAVATTKVLGLVWETSISAAAAGNIQTDGIITVSDWTAIIGAASLTPGSIYYLSGATAGQLTATAPSTAGHYVLPVGMAISTTEMNILTDQQSVLLA